MDIYLCFRSVIRWQESDMVAGYTNTYNENDNTEE